MRFYWQIYTDTHTATPTPCHALIENYSMKNYSYGLHEALILQCSHLKNATGVFEILT